MELLRDGFVLLAERDLYRAKAIAEFWRELDYPIFHRLYLFGMAEVDGIARSADVMVYFKRYPHVIFAFSCEREVLRFFRKRGGILSKKASAQVCARILKGLDRTQYRPMSDDEWEGMNGREVWKRLAALALIRNAHMLLYKLRKDRSHLVEEFPDAVLELLYLTTSQAGDSHYGLREVLDCLLVARPDFRTDRRFHHLERIA